MAAPWLRTAPALFLLASLCCTSLSHGRTIPGQVDISTEVSLRERNSSFSVSEYNSSKTSEAQDSSSGTNKIVNRTGDTDSDWQPEDHFISIVQGQNWKGTLGKVAEWILNTCVVLLAFVVLFYTVSCISACCVGLDLLGEIWRALGGCGALRALLSYFVNFEQAITEGQAQSVPLRGGAPQQY